MGAPAAVSSPPPPLPLAPKPAPPGRPGGEARALCRRTPKGMFGNWQLLKVNELISFTLNPVAVVQRELEVSGN